MPIFEDAVETSGSGYVMKVKTKQELTQAGAVIDSKLSRAFSDGVLFTLSIGKQSWKVPPNYADFGLQALSGIFDLGKFELLPYEATETVHRLESQARRFLDSKSFHFGEDARSGFRFVRLKFAVDVDMELTRRQTEFFGAVETLLSGLEDFRAQARTAYLEKWEALKKSFPTVDGVQSNYLLREEHWNKLALLYPSAADARKRYKFSFGQHAMAFPDQFESVSFKQLVREHAHDVAYLEHVEKMKTDSRRRIESEVTSFIQDTVRSTRKDVLDVFQEMQAKIQGDKPLTPQNVKKLREVMLTVREMTSGFLEDDQFTRQTERVLAQIEGRTEFREGDQATRALASIFGETIQHIASTTETAVVEVTDAYFSRKLQL